MTIDNGDEVNAACGHCGYLIQGMEDADMDAYFVHTCTKEDGYIIWNHVEVQ